MNRRGFTLLEMLVATLIMGVAVVASISAIGNSVRNASRLTAYDRAVMQGRAKMRELLADQRLPLGAKVEGTFGGDDMGWNALMTPFAIREGSPPGTPILQRVQLEIWWMAGGQRHSLPLEGYRRGVMPAAPL